MLRKSLRLHDAGQNRKKHQLAWLWLSGLVIGLDYITKYWMSHWLDNSSLIPVLPCLNFILSQNFGAAFSFLGQANGWQRWLFIIISIGASIWLIRLLYRDNLTNWVACALSLIIGGAIGNLHDRISLGYVVDFIDFYIGNWHFPTFNLADSAISIGAIMWVIASIKHSKKNAYQ